MLTKSVELGSRLIPLPFEDTPDYRRMIANIYASMWGSHPTVWEMHVINRQFVEFEGVSAIPATKHCVAQALRADVLADMLGLRPALTHELVAGVLLTDSYKAEKRRYMNRVSPSWDSYAEAQRLAKASWVDSGMFSPNVITIASSVAHETLLDMEQICDGKFDHLCQDPFTIARLVAHYVDDISRNHDWVEEAGEHGNMLDLRMQHNARNPAYAQLNEEGRLCLRQEAVDAGLPRYFTGYETTYEAQARVGHRVERVLARLIGRRFDLYVEPIDLPVIVDNSIRGGMIDLMRA